ncbi:DUF7509 family protein [Haloterrigena alkaliphila]|uniref:DUF7509 domain-containing protein n=1 Tax=Haloterrigena alkaliphila TaxID=2816475 RepID=A0A8A2VAY7_9EURY|nr:hypothetical protein [Haloterrigena alkaliphila]QSW97877.1 hypothetical protein J0X25_10645 [Haloterrigena alkaliphila]
MTSEITRELITRQLGDVSYDRFLLYLMGPYKSFNLNYVLTDEERAEVDVDSLPGPLRKLFQNEDSIDEAKALLRRLQGNLRADPGVNAFLAVDVNVDTDEVDAVTQSIEFSSCANATVFVLPFLGHNFGVGEEAGSILENLAETHGDRIVFVYEANVTSEMIRSARTRWDLRIETYETETELVDTVRRFVVTTMNRERFGDLEFPG